MKCITLLGMAILVLGLGTVNIQHHINVPEELQTSTRTSVSHFWNVKFPFYHKKTEIQLADEIKGPNTVRYVDLILLNAEKGDVIVFELAGYGGEVESVFSIIDSIHASKADITMHVLAPVYSGHAYLALSGHHLIIEDNSYIMLHTSTMIDKNCDTEQGLDRGVSNVEHCQRMKEAHMLLVNRAIIGLPYVTAAEKLQIIAGHSVYIDSSTVNVRMLVGMPK